MSEKDTPTPPAPKDDKAPRARAEDDTHHAHRGHPAWAHGIAAGLCLYFFLSAINVIGSGLKHVGKNTDALERFLSGADNPFVALLGSVIVTSLVQSSSFTTSLIITLTAAGVMDVEAAVFAVMGANIGTSVTNTIVALGQVKIKRQFRRAFTAAIVHDIFNWLTVAVLFPIEWISGASHESGKGWLMRCSEWAASFISSSEYEKPFNPVKWVTSPVVKVFEWFGDLVTGAMDWVGIDFSNEAVADGIFVAVLGLGLLFVALAYLVKNLKGALLDRIEGMFRSYFFRNDFVAYIVGGVTTVLVQSSSVTTSLIVPLAGAGAVKIRRVLPYTLGANLGTTITGVLAATANPEPAAIAVAIAHITFNLLGTAIWYPLRFIPFSLAHGYARIAARSKWNAIGYLLLAFFVLPLLGVIFTEIILGLL